MENTKVHPLNDFMKYKVMLKPSVRGASFMRLVGLISKKEAKKMLEGVNKSRTEWR